MIHAYAVKTAGGTLEPFDYNPGPLKDEEVEINVETCGICHSDLSMIQNHWGITQFPLVAGHEVVGVIGAVGSHVSAVKTGQRVGLGWYAGSCMHCESCMSGDHNLCLSAQPTIIGHYGGFADKVRAHQSWVTPLPEGIDPDKAGPLFCGGITVFDPLVQFGISPTDRVGVIGIGGLGHLALQFLHAWGCDVTAFSTSAEKEAEARGFGAKHFVNISDPQVIGSVANSYDYIISTVNTGLDWSMYINALRPKGRLHFVGVLTTPIQVGAFPLILGQKTVSATPVGSPATAKKMLDFAARHGIETKTEFFEFSRINEALAYLDSGKARYRIVLKH